MSGKAPGFPAPGWLGVKTAALMALMAGCAVFARPAVAAAAESLLPCLFLALVFPLLAPLSFLGRAEGEVGG